MKLLLFAIAVVALLWLLKGSLATWRGERPRRDDARRTEPPREGAEEMLRCSECGLHLPRGESLPGKGGVFCSDAHRAAHESRLARRDGDGR